MKYLKLAFALVLSITPSFAQSSFDYYYVVSDDTIYINEQFVGYIEKDSNPRVAYVYSRFIVSKIRSYEKAKSPSDRSFDKVEVAKDLLLKFNLDDNSISDYLGNIVGKIEIIKKLGIPLITKLTRSNNTYNKYHFIDSWKSASSKRFSIITISRLDSEEMERIEREKKRIEKNRLKAEIEAEKNRIERFYAMLTERLSQELDPIEGVYKSIDQGESFEYDIAILKSLSNEREYISVVLASSDPSFTIGSGIITFTKTAGPDVYFLSYQNKAGQQFQNKTATFDGVLLSMGIKSFVKMYPSEGELRKYNEVNPLFDWESSGSGVLINKDGYIVTNNHVATGADRIRIAFQNDSIDYNAVIISQNEATDVAILKIEDDRFESNIEPVNWETDFNLGQKVFTLGYPISNKMSNNVKVVDGIVSGENGVGGSPIYFQTTLPVWYGNSGGPCFNSKGEILGLATQILWDQGAKVDNVAYITKTENILNLAGDIINHNSKASQDKDLEQLIEELIPYSVFIKVNY
jgi:S1-C subfamily serine protease